MISCAPISICSHLKNVKGEHSVSLQGSKWLFYIVGHFNLMTLKTTNIALSCIMHYIHILFISMHWRKVCQSYLWREYTLYFLINTGLTKDDISWCLVHFSKFGSSCESYLTWIRCFYFCLFFAKCELLLKWTVKTSTLKLVSHNSINRNGLRISAVFRYIPAAKRCVSTLPCLSLVLQHNALG